MLFSPFYRVKGLYCLLVGGMVTGLSAKGGAQNLTAPTPLPLPLPYASALEEDAPQPLPPDFPPSLDLRASQPAAGQRFVPIGAPPDTFGQTLAQIQPWLLELPKLRPAQVKSRVLGQTTGGRPIMALEIAPAGITPWKLKRLLVICRQHGNEPEATASGARFIREFLTTTDPRKRAIAQKTALLIVPVANPDGAAVYRRRTDSNVDMNRDWGRFHSGEVQLLTYWIREWKPQLVVDVHQWLPDETQPPPMAEASGGTLARQTAQVMAQNSAHQGYWLAARSRWGLDTLCHRYWGQRFHIPAILLESRHRPNVAGARDVAIGTSLAALWGAAETVSR